MKSEWRTSHKQIGEQENNEDCIAPYFLSPDVPRVICFSVTTKYPQMPARFRQEFSTQTTHGGDTRSCGKHFPLTFPRGSGAASLDVTGDPTMSCYLPPRYLPLKLTRPTCRELDSSLSTPN